ncbi:hypothetical protein [Photobacterium toruni]|uniref:hypothetical protein n=1 Tax=Photobacterium toruni TaxID=1935446 RepID=UPI00210F9B68|nr:hypothetical protein [Photobacterium toruni]
MDPVDPINLAKPQYKLNKPISIFIQMADGDTTIPNKPDKTILPYSPFTGTLPLIERLKSIHEEQNTLTISNKSYADGNHNSLLEIVPPRKDKDGNLLFSIEKSTATTINMQKDMTDFLNK